MSHARDDADRYAGRAATCRPLTSASEHRCERVQHGFAQTQHFRQPRPGVRGGSFGGTPEARTENRAVATEASPTNLAVPQRKEPVPPAPAIEGDHAKAPRAELADKSLPSSPGTSSETADDRPGKIGAATLAPRPSAIGYGRRIDKSKLWLALEQRIRDKAHLKRVAELPCLICNRQPSHAHHLRFAQRRGMSQKVSDEFVVPLCALHHGDLHRSSSEQDWWGRQKIDPLAVCRDLWSRHVRDS